jgi:hypothetical protein
MEEESIGQRSEVPTAMPGYNRCNHGDQPYLVPEVLGKEEVIKLAHILEPDTRSAMSMEGGVITIYIDF